jgi:prolyl-tRNA synthetase
MPIFKTDDERGMVLEYCEALRTELAGQMYDGEPVRVRLDARDIRGGDKKWHWVKRGVPIRLEVGPRDIASGELQPGRRDSADRGPKLSREKLVAGIGKMLADIQQALFDRAAKLRETASVQIDSLAEFEKFFTPKNADDPEIHGGLAWCHFADSPEMDAKLKELKATVRCVPIDAADEPGKCIFTGKPSTKRGVFAKAY